MTSFYYVVKKDSFSKAADYLGYSQSNISQQIRKLELFYETPLLFKRKQKIILTTNGQAVYRFTQQLLKEHDYLLESLKLDNTQQVKIGTIDSISANLFAGYLSELKLVAPTAHIEIMIDREYSLLEKLNNNELDVIIIFDKMLTNQTAFSHYYAKESFNLVRHKSKQAPKTILSLILTDKECSYRQSFLATYQTKLPFTVAFEVENTHTIKELLSFGTESAFLPNYACRHLSKEDYEYQSLPLEQPFFLQCLYSPEKNNKVLDQFVSIVLKDPNFHYYIS